MFGTQLPTSADDPRGIYELFREFFPTRGEYVAYSDDVRPLLIQIKDHPNEIARSRLKLIMRKMTQQKMNIERLMCGQEAISFSEEGDPIELLRGLAEEGATPLEEVFVNDFDKQRIVQRMIDERLEIREWIAEILEAHKAD